MQVEAIKHQLPVREDKDAGKRSTQIVGDHNSMNYKHRRVPAGGGALRHRAGMGQRDRTGRLSPSRNATFPVWRI